jgi:predicted RNA binding protein YcfA (HicA-like mRNA interferase family)
VARLPVLPFRDIDRTLTRLGFVATRQKGSHVFYRHPDGRTTTVPRHGGRDIAPPLLRKILDDIGISVEAFLAALRS